MRMRYDRGQVMAAAQFIWDNNPAVRCWPSQPKSALDVFDDIMQFGKRHGVRNMQDPDNWSGWSGTGGYLVMFTSDEDDVFDIDVYVDPAVGNHGQVNEEYIIER